jgi:hypothetical protein
MRGRPVNPNTRSEIRHCERCGDDTEWRQYRGGKHRSGNPNIRWVCVPCNRAKALTGYHRRMASCLVEGEQG